MLRILVPLVLLLLGVGGGLGAGIILRPGSAADTGSEVPVGGDGTTDADVAPSGDTHENNATGPTEFVRLNNQFVVPIVRNGAVRSLVVLALTLEVDAGQNGAVFDREPRLRDAFLQVLFAHANAGGFDGSFTQSAAMDPLREALREAAHRVLGDLVRDVLIVDITRQDA